MTTSISVDALPGGDAVRRDGYGRYLIVPPAGGKPIGYTRVTTVAKALDPGGGLADWKSTMTASGIIMRRGLRSRWEALMAESGGDPWYRSQAFKAASKQLVEDCAAAGGADDRREVGTALHTLTALVDLGQPIAHLTEETEADLAAYTKGLEAAGISIVPGAVEITVVLDGYRVAGMFDRVVTVPDFDRPLIADLKTGADLSYSWQSIAVQLAAYSRAEAVYRQGPAADGSGDVRNPMLEVDQDWGLIMWLNAGSGSLELFLVDLNAGWEAFEHSMWARGWRSNSKVSVPFSQRPTNLSNALQASLDAVRAPAEVVPAPGDHRTRLRAWLQDRIDLIGQYPAARTDLGQSWPDLPTLKHSEDHTSEQLAVIEQLLWDVEKRHRIPFPVDPRPAEPTQEEMGRVLNLFPGSTLTNQPTNPPTDKEPV